MDRVVPWSASNGGSIFRYDVRDIIWLGWYCLTRKCAARIVRQSICICASDWQSSAESVLLSKDYLGDYLIVACRATFLYFSEFVTALYSFISSRLDYTLCWDFWEDTRTIVTESKVRSWSGGYLWCDLLRSLLLGWCLLCQGLGSRFQGCGGLWGHGGRWVRNSPLPLYKPKLPLCFASHCSSGATIVLPGFKLPDNSQERHAILLDQSDSSYLRYLFQNSRYLKVLAPGTLQHCAEL